MREFQALDRAGNAGGAVTGDAILGGVAGRIEIHVSRGGAGGSLAKIEKSGAAVGKGGEKKPATADIARGGVGDGQRESDGDGGVDRVAAGLQDVDADV